MKTLLGLLLLVSCATAPTRDGRGPEEAQPAQVEDLVTAGGEPRLRTWKPVPLADGLRAAVPASDGTVRIFSLETGATVVVLGGHEGTVFAVEPAPKGTALASCGEDGTIRLWDVADHSCRAVLQTPKPLRPFWGETFSFSPKGDRLVAIAAGTGWARVWDATSGDVVHALPMDAEITSAAWTPDGHLVSVGRDRMARVWDVEAGREVREPLQHEAVLEHVACHPDGARIVTGGAHGTTVWTWDLETGERLAEVRVGDDPVPLQYLTHLVFSQDGEDLLVATTSHWGVFCLATDTFEPRWNIETSASSAAPCRVELDHSGERVAVSVLYRVVRREDGSDVSGSPARAGFFEFSPGDRFVVAHSRCITYVLDGTTLELLYTRSEQPQGKSTVRRDE